MNKQSKAKEQLWKSIEQKAKLKKAQYEAKLAKRRETYKKTKGLTAAQRMMGETLI
jgi:hypothetical protein